MLIGNIIAIACLVFGFGFVVFFHELGHFLAAKWVGIRCEQFAIGFGHAICAWRKGMGWRVGTTTPEYEQRLKEHIQSKQLTPSREKVEPTPVEMSKAADELKLGDTEYRLNWIPLGGYVKMRGQDDMNPNAQSEDPRAYNRKPIGARMLVVSAGVIMNVILAAILFMVVFLIGFRVPPAIVGNIEPGSPAQKAGLKVGDQVLYMEGEYQHDFTKLHLNTALAPVGMDVPVKVRREGKEIDLTVRPQPAENAAGTFLSLGIGYGAISELRGLNPNVQIDLPLEPKTSILPGDVITEINGAKVENAKTDYWKLDQAIQESKGQPVKLTVSDAKGAVRQVEARLHLQEFFGHAPVNLAGLQPRPMVAQVQPKSPVEGKLLKGDVMVEVRVNGELIASPNTSRFVQAVAKAGAARHTVGFVVERGGKLVTVDEVVPNVRTGKGRRGLGVGLDLEEQRPVLSEPLQGSAAELAKIPKGALITKVNGHGVKDWFDVHQQLKSAGDTAVVTYVPIEDGKPAEQKAAEATLRLSSQEREMLANVRYRHDLLLGERIDERQTSNPLTAAEWGVTETRCMLLQFYVTIRRLIQGSVSTANLMGPIGIVHAGSLFAFRGSDWLIWFLAMISANLAVVNFLPIPIVDGGLFVFLIVEKIWGRPLSPRMQTAAQIVGLAIILSLFLLVTYQDIARLWM